MTFTMNILIDLLLIFAVWQVSRRQPKVIVHKYPYTDKSILGKLSKVEVKSAIASKMADRAFNTANTATLGVVALQKALAVPRIMTKQQVKQNQLAKTEVDKLFNSSGSFDWLRPILSDEENDLLDEAEKLKVKTQMESEN